MNNESPKADKKTKIFYTIFFVLILISVAVTFYRYVILKDYQIVAEVSCDPAVEKCFVYVCDPADDSACPENIDERTSYYKIINKNASDIYNCEKTEEKIGCNEELSCLSNELKCSYTLCDPTNLADGEECSE